MASRRVDIRLDWENGVFFEMRRRVDGGDWVSIVKVEENANIKTITSPLLSLCVSDMRNAVEEAIKEMEA